MNKYILLSALFFVIFNISSCSGDEQDQAVHNSAYNADSTDTQPVASETTDLSEAPLEVSERLIRYFQSKYGTRLPQGSEVTVSGFESTAFEGFERGYYDVEIPGRAVQQIPFLITKDGNHLVIGVAEITDFHGFKKSPVEGFKQGEIVYGNNRLPVLISDDHSHIIVGEVLDSRVDPFKKVMEGISLDNVPVKGDKDAKVTIVEYSDFQCPFCRRGSQMLPRLLEEYKGDIKIYYKQLPLPNHDWARSASRASLCAFDQGNKEFWDFHESIFTNQGRINAANAEERFREFAGYIGLDMDQFENCIQSTETDERVEKEFQEAQQLGINSTPTYIVDGIIVSGADFDGLKNAIESRLSAN